MNMKLIRIQLKQLALMFALVAVCPVVSAVEYVIGLAQDYPNEFDRNAVNDQITRFVIKSLNPGDNLYVMDAKDVKTLVEFKLPNKDEYKNTNLKRRKFGKELIQLRQKIASLPKSPGNTSHSLLNVPQFLEHLSVSKFDILKSDNRKVSVLLIGNAFFQDSRESDFFNMREGWFPSDGHIKVDRKGSIYGAKDRAGYLKGVSVHHLVTNKESDWYSDLYKNRINRFWHLYVNAQAGKYATFTSDVSTAFDRFATPDLQPMEAFDFDYTAGKVEMLRATRLPVPSNNTKVTSEGAEFMNDNVPISKTPPSKTKGLLKIGIRWGCKNCDVDLYAKSNTAPNYLYYSHGETEEGKYFKDFTSSPDTINGLEYIEFTRDVDIKNLSVLVNLFSGFSLTGIDGVVRAYFDGKVYEKPFNIKAMTGNNGSDIEQASTSRNWAVIDVKSLFSL